MNVRGRLEGVPVALLLLPFFAVVVDSLGRLRPGPYSINAYLTLATALLLVIAVIGARVRWPGLGFAWLVLAVVGGALQFHGPQSMQNLAVYAAAVCASALAANRTAPLDLPRFLGIVRAASWSFVVVFGVSIVAGYQVGYGSRSGAMVAVLLLGIAASRVAVSWSASSWADRALPAVLLFEVALSFSRTALAVGMIALAISLTAVRGRLREPLVASALAAVIFGLLVATWAPLRERFFVGDGGVHFGPIALNTEGRAALWGPLTAAWAESPVFGHGAGYAESVTSSVTGGLIAQPHSDYLRVLVDQGFVGLMLLLVVLVGGTVVSLRRALRSSPEHRPVHTAAAAALVTVMLLMATDNPLVYVFVGVPAGVLVGLSRRLARPDEMSRIPLWTSTRARTSR